MAGGPRRGEPEPQRPLLRRVDPEVQRTSVVAEHVLAALRDVVLRALEAVEPARRAERAQRAREVHLLVRGGEEEDVAVEGQTLAVRADQGQELHDPFRLHVLRAAAVDEAVLHRGREGRHRPPARVRRHHVHVVGEDQCAPRPAAFQGRDQVGPAGRELVDLGRDALAVEDVLVEARRAQLVAGRVGGVDLEVLAQQVDRHVLVGGARRRVAGGRGQRGQGGDEDEGDRAHATSQRAPEDTRVCPRQGRSGSSARMGAIGRRSVHERTVRSRRGEKTSPRVISRSCR